MYKLTSAWPQRDDGAFVNPDSNPGYLAWLAAGNTSTPADVPDPKIAILADIDRRERAVMLPRGVREFMLSEIEDKAAIAGAAQGLTRAQSLAVLVVKNPGYRNIKAMDDQIAVLRQAAK